MNKKEYLDNNNVRDFLNWIDKIIDENSGFRHNYIDNSSKAKWSCSSLYGTHEGYYWKGYDYKETEYKLDRFSDKIKESLSNKNNEDFKYWCIEILKWGGVKNKNDNKILGMKNILNYFNSTIMKLSPERVDTNDNFNGIIMNSGFTKIYSLLINDFIIYDSRVGSALCLLVRMFLEKKDIREIPDELNFSWAVKKMNKYTPRSMNNRNPNNDTYKFPYLEKDIPHIISNIKANWLVYEISKMGNFKSCKNPIRAVESALFMIGYDVNNISNN